MRITEVLKGDPRLAGTVIEVVMLDELPTNEMFWLVSYDGEPSEWVSPRQISSRSLSYLRQLTGLPESGPKRLEFFLPFLGHTDELVADDAYNEFAEATLEDIAGLKDQLDRDWILSQLRDASVSPHRRRLCWTFLSQCGTAEDACLFDEVLRYRREDAAFDPGMDAAIACLITLTGERGLARIERDFLSNPEAAFSDAFSATSAVRVHGTELQVIPRERLAAAMRQSLSNPAVATLVIPDLARWEDWSAIGRVEELFRDAPEADRFLKPAVVLYLKACPLPQAATALDRLRVIDPVAVRRAEASMNLYPGLASVPVPPADKEPLNPKPSEAAETRSLK